MFPVSDTASKKKILQDRARMLSSVRSFFLEKNVLEVDVPAVSQKPAIDLHIEVMKTIRD